MLRKILRSGVLPGLILFFFLLSSTSWAQTAVSNGISGNTCIGQLGQAYTYTAVFPDMANSAYSSYTIDWSVSSGSGELNKMSEETAQVNWLTFPGELTAHIYYYVFEGFDENGDPTFRFAKDEISYLQVGAGVTTLPNVIGSSTGKTSFAFNQIPDPLIESSPTGLSSVCGQTNYQWLSSETPLGPFTTIANATASSCTFSAPIAKTMYFQRRIFDGNGGESYSNVLEVDLVSINWENLNYVRQYDIKVTGIATSQAAYQLSGDQKIQATTYVDGLGRNLQQVMKEAAAPAPGQTQWGDIVKFYKYDELGRSPDAYLPYVSTALPGKFKTDPLADQQAYYLSTLNETMAYSHSSFENAPGNRILNVKDPGTVWSASAGRSAGYELNTIDDNVQILSVDYVRGNAPIHTGVYPPNTLFKSISIKEDGKEVIDYKDKSGHNILRKIQVSNTPSAGHSGWMCTYTVFDDYGRMRYQLQPECVNYLDTHNWSFSGDDGRKVLYGYCFQYDYDDKGNNVWKKEPGADPTKMVYDIRNRLVFSQDGNQAPAAAQTKGEWLTKLYDIFDRPVITVLYKTLKSEADLAADLKLASAQTNVTTQLSSISTDLVVDMRQPGISRYVASNSIEFTATPAPGFESTAGDDFEAEIDPSAQSILIASRLNISAIGQTDLGDPATCTVLKYEFYDDYNFQTYKSFDPAFANGNAYSTADPNVLPIAVSNRTLGMRTGELIRVLGTNTFLGSTLYFDDKGRSIQESADNIKSGRDVTTLQYNFDGRLLSTHVKHTVPNSGYTDYSILTKNLFDKLGRITQIQKKYGLNPFKNIVAYTYDDMGRIKRKVLDPDYVRNGSPGLETLDYSFNIQNEITGVNKDYALKTANLYNKWAHFFGFYLGYDKTDGVFEHTRLNGQVSGVVWTTQGDDVQRRFEYEYNNAGRLSNAVFRERKLPADAWVNDKMDFSVTGAGGKISYDLNGNLLSMLQKGVFPGKSAPVIIDQLSYAYEAFGNKLLSVTDQTSDHDIDGKLGDFKDGATTGTPDYVYDKVGNVVADLNKNIKDLAGSLTPGSGIEYNYLDKPSRINVAGKGVIKIIYDASGKMLERSFTPVTGDTKTTTYVNQFVYESTAGGPAQLSLINFEEGRIRVITPVAQSNSYDALTIDGSMDLPNSMRGVYQYYLTDYQQNVRMVLSEEINVASSTCSMENNRATIEDAVFGQAGNANEVEASRVPVSQTNWQNAGIESSVSRLGNIAGHQLGPNTLQKVMAGDQVVAHVQYFYQGASGNVGNNMVPLVVQSLVQAITTGGVGAVKDATSDVGTQLSLNSSFGSVVQAVPGASTNPEAYLTILFFDERFNFIKFEDGGVYQQQVGALSGNNGSTLTISDAKAPKNGYVYIYVSNQSDQNVYFDNLSVTTAAGNIEEENHFYPYGLKIASISSSRLQRLPDASENHKELYNGKEFLTDADLNWYNYGFRNYDPQIGRFMQLDPLADGYPFLTPYQYASCDPVTNIDIDGLEGGSSVLEPVIVTAHIASGANEALFNAAVVYLRSNTTYFGNLAAVYNYRSASGRCMWAEGVQRNEIMYMGEKWTYQGSAEITPGPTAEELMAQQVEEMKRKLFPEYGRAMGFLEAAHDFLFSMVSIANPSMQDNTLIKIGKGLWNYATTPEWERYQLVADKIVNYDYSDPTSQGKLIFNVSLLVVPGLGEEALATDVGEAVTVTAKAAPAAEEEYLILYRGESQYNTVIKSYAAQEGGYAYSQKLIEEGDLDDLMFTHSLDSQIPSSPFISTTTDPRVARYFAGENGVVRQFRIPKSRALFNHHNKIIIDEIGGLPEAEYLVPNYIRPSEIIY